MIALTCFNTPAIAFSLLTYKWRSPLNQANKSIAMAEVKLGPNHPNTLNMKERLASLPSTPD
jgi:hypothetical protein